MKRKIVLYTAQEVEFLHKVLELFGIEFLLYDSNTAIKGKEFLFDCDDHEYLAIAACMKANYLKNFN